MAAIDWQSVRDQFPVTEQVTYLDSSAVGPMPKFLADAHLLAFRHRVEGPRRDDVAVAAQRAAVDRMARYLGVDGEDLVFLSSTTEAINVVATALPLQPGDEIVVHDRDFPSNLYPWVRWAERGVHIRRAPSEAGRLSVDAVLEQVTERTRIVALSHVFYQSGYRVDLEALGKALRARGVWLSVDGIQALGLLRPDLRWVDFYMGATFKSLLGPFGLAVLYARRDTAERLRPAMVGYASLATEEIPWETGAFAYRPGAQRFQLSHVNTPGLYILARVLEFLEGIGWDNITARVLELTGAAVEALARMDGVTVLTPADPARRLGIVAFDVGGLAAEEVVRRLRDAGIVVAAREGHVRASFHIYNNEADVDRLVSAVRRLPRQSGIPT
jgi:cysteine desulfurase/selenocysteine lyase